MLGSLLLKLLELLETPRERIYRNVELGTRQSRELSVTSCNLALAAALHTAGDIRAGASLQSGDRNGPLHDRLAGLRCVHLLHDAGKNVTCSKSGLRTDEFFQLLNAAAVKFDFDYI